LYENKLHTEFTEQFSRANLFIESLLGSNNHNNNISINNPNNDNNPLTTIILSSTRKISTLSITLSSLISSMNKYDELYYKLYVLNTARPHSNNEIADKIANNNNIPYLKCIALELESDRINIKKYYNNNDRPQHESWIWQQIIDYIYSLDFCQHLHEKQYANINKGYCLILEDDIIVSNNFYTKLQYSINQYNLNNRRNYGWTKLFVTNHWSGFERKDIQSIILSSIYITTNSIC